MTELLEGWLNSLDYWNILILMAIESSFIPFPSEVVVPPAACMACMADSHLNIFWVIIVATIGANIGALVNYFIARTLGRAVVYRFADSRLGHLCLLNGEKVQKSEEYFRKHGVASTFFGRLVPAVRQLISIPAGLARMDLKKFMLHSSAAVKRYRFYLGSPTVPLSCAAAASRNRTHIPLRIPHLSEFFLSCTH